MQMFFLKNMVSVSIAALIFSAIIIGTVAEQEPAASTEPMAEDMKPNLAPSTNEGSRDLEMSDNPTDSLAEMPQSEGNGEIEAEAALPIQEEAQPNAMAPSEETNPELPKLNGESESTVYQEMVEGEMNQVEIPEGTPESRVQKRLQILNELDEGMTDQPSPAESTDQSQDATPPSSPQNDMVPHMAESQGAMPAPETEAAQSAPVAEAAAPEVTEAQTVATPAAEVVMPTPAATEPALAPTEPASEVKSSRAAREPTAEDITLAPEASLDSKTRGANVLSAGQAAVEPSAGDLVNSTLSTMNAAIIKPKLIMAPKAWDDEEERPVPEKEDPGSPESEGKGPKGKHKGGPQMAHPKVRIIKMGEDVKEEGGFMILKPWNS